MIAILSIILTLFVSQTNAAIGEDLSCTVFNGTAIVYAPEAADCSNSATEEWCAEYYTETGVTAWSDMERPTFCYGFLDSPEVVPFQVRIAILNCPKTCGYCCRTAAYNCKNAENPRVSCEDVTESMCQSEIWWQILVEDCPSQCGFCDRRYA